MRRRLGRFSARRFAQSERIVVPPKIHNVGAAPSSLLDEGDRLPEDSPKLSSAKQRILDSAEQLFAERGFSWTSLRAITSAGGVNLAAANYHFRSKEALFHAVLARRLNPLNRERLELLGDCEAMAEGGSFLSIRSSQPSSCPSCAQFTRMTSRARTLGVLSDACVSIPVPKHGGISRNSSPRWRIAFPRR